MKEMQRIRDKRPIDSIKGRRAHRAQKLLDVMVICPCTGNTWQSWLPGVTDSSVTTAAKAHLRNGRPLIIAVPTNDGPSGSAKNIGTLLDKKTCTSVPFRQDDPGEEAHLAGGGLHQKSPETIEAARKGEQIQPPPAGLSVKKRPPRTTAALDMAPMLSAGYGRISSTG